MKDIETTWPEEFRDLDSPETYAFDKSDMYSWIEKWDKLLSTGMSRFMGNIEGKFPNGRDIKEVLVCGMGGSAITGDVAYMAVREMLPVPYRVIRSYSPPASLGEGSLEIVVSYSGNTEEAVWAYTQGHNRGAKVVVVASGGALVELATRHGWPFIELPADCPAPRLALGYLVPAVLAVIDRVFDEVHGLEDITEDAVVALRRGVKRYERRLGTQKNVAKRLASEMHGAFPVIVGSDLTRPAAMRFQTQLNENAKWPAHAAELPEMNHNEIVAYTCRGPASSRTGVLLLRDRDDHPRVQLRQDFTADMLDEKVAWIRQMKGEGKSVFARVMNLIQAADYTSYYLACGRGVDPLDISAISTLKDRLGKVQ